MNQRRYHSLVKRLELDAAINPSAYRAKVFLMSVAAYVVLFGILLIIALMVYAGIRFAHRPSTLIHAGLLILTVIPVFFVVLRMFFFRLLPPEGRPLTRAEAPMLWNVLDKMRQQLNGPPIHHILIDDEFNAMISQRPRWGLFGGHTNYLVLGLPFMLGLSPKEMLAVVGHEYGHVCGNHGKFGAWIYRQRLTFHALYHQIESGGVITWIHYVMLRLLATFMPYYDAYTFVLSREDEYEADRTATELFGSDPNAQGLIRGELLGHWIDKEFWPQLYKQADSREKPVCLPFGSMPTVFKVCYFDWANQKALDAAWSEPSNLHDTHPALRERVEAIGKTPLLPERIEKTAAEVLLGTMAKVLIDEFDSLWWEKEKDSWDTRYQYAIRSKARLLELSRLPAENMPLQDLHERAVLSAEFEPPQTAKALLERLMRQPGGPFPKASYHYGCLLLLEGDERGLDHLATAADLDEHLRESALFAGYRYLLEKYDEERAMEWVNEIQPQQEEE